jgi:hypothetical protein
VTSEQQELLVAFAKDPPTKELGLAAMAALCRITALESALLDALEYTDKVVQHGEDAERLRVARAILEMRAYRPRPQRRRRGGRQYSPGAIDYYPD